jgi:uncharacterized membrane protein
VASHAKAQQQVRRFVLGGLVLTLAGFLLVPAPFRLKLDFLAAGVCAQRPDHSYFLGGAQLPLEARMGGIFLGFLVGVLYLGAVSRERAGLLPPTAIQYALFGGIGLMALDGSNALLYDLGLPALYPPQNAGRLATGLLCGAAVACLAVPVLNTALWRDWDLEPSLGGGRDLAWLVAALVPVQAAVMSGAAALFYPVALLMAVGLVVAFTVGNAYALALIVLPADARATSWREASIPLLGGTLLTIYELLALAALRVWSESTLGVRWPV